MLNLQNLLDNEKIKTFIAEKEDQAMWIALGLGGLVFALMFTLFTTSGPFFFLQRYILALLVIFVPGYVIVKLFFDNIRFSEHKIVDKVFMSVGLSLITVQPIVFLLQYIVQFGLFDSLDERLGLKVDAETINNNWRTIGVVLFVLAVTVALKYYLKLRAVKKAA